MRLVCPPTQEEEALETFVRVVAAAAGADDDACSLCSPLSHSGGNRGATFASNYFNLRPRLPLWTDRQTDRQTPWHNYCGIEMTLKRRVWGKGEFNSFQLSKPTTFCKCLISIMTRRCLHCGAPPYSTSFFLSLSQPTRKIVGHFCHLALSRLRIRWQ